ncbi:hypothetical protein [Saccharicrinis sp. GN24d3]|uniref:hypothetical protein n=1 Tax=Saccharicrinis sp. GN24d3 TaxID=3458416 RepID=UPI004036092A
MKILHKTIYPILLIILQYACTYDASEVMSPNSMVITKSGGKLFVADETANNITIIDREKPGTIEQINLEASPSGLVLSADERKLYVTLSGADGKLIELNLNSHEIIRSLNVGHTPMAPVLSQDGQTLFLCNRFENNICSIALNSFTVTHKTSVVREPVAIALPALGNNLYVANHLPSGSATSAYHSSKVSVVETQSMKVIKEISLPNGSNALNKISFSPDNKYLYVTHILARYNVPTNQVERGWINTNALSIIELKNDNYLCTVLLDDLDLGAANPFDVKCSQDGSKLFVSHSGTSELSVIDREALHKRISQVNTGSTSTLYASALVDIQNDLSLLQDIRTRITLEGKGAKGIALHDNRVYVSMYYSGTVVEINLADMSSPGIIGLGKQPLPTQERLGEIYFNDATLCKQHWQSCASCHPGNARVDGLNWDNLNDGLGNPKNTKSMLLAHSTAPSMITGIRANAEMAVRAGIAHIFFTNQPEEIAVAMDTYLSALTPVPSPYLVDGKLSESAKRGQLVYEKANCNSCHSGPHLTNLQKYDVGIGTGLEEGRKFDTPSLVEIWRTAPYLYNGKAKDLREVFTKYNKNQKHGNTSDLTSRELDDLIAFCLSH